MSEPESHRSLTQIIARLVARIDSDAIPAGDLANLRRLDPKRPPGMAFWKLYAELIEPDQPFQGTSEQLADRERRWAAVLQLLATLRGLRSDEVWLGRGLAEAGYSELRLERLLRSEGQPLLDTVRKVATFLAAKGQHLDPRQLALLVLGHDPEHLDPLRRNIARDYFRALHLASTPS